MPKILNVTAAEYIRRKLPFYNLTGKFCGRYRSMGYVVESCGKIMLFCDGVSGLWLTSERKLPHSRFIKGVVDPVVVPHEELTYAATHGAGARVKDKMQEALNG